MAVLNLRCLLDFKVDMASKQLDSSRRVRVGDRNLRAIGGMWMVFS